MKSACCTIMNRHVAAIKEFLSCMLSYTSLNHMTEKLAKTQGRIQYLQHFNLNKFASSH